MLETFNPVADKLREQLSEIEMDVLTSYTLSDAMREGCKVSKQYPGWGGGEYACALSAAAIAAKARGYSE